MYLIDRMILAYYSIDSMNAAAISGNFVAIFSFIFTSIAGISEIYVEQRKASYTEVDTYMTLPKFVQILKIDYSNISFGLKLSSKFFHSSYFSFGRGNGLHSGSKTAL